MKKIILSVAAVFAFGFANAQEATEGGKGFTKGDIFVSGSFGFSSEKTGDFKTSDFNITPSVGLFVDENIAVGLSVGYLSSKVDVGGADATNSGFTAGAFGRYYFTPSNDFSLFAQLGFDYMTVDTEFAYDTDGSLVPSEGEISGFEIALRPGVSYFISSNFALEASIGALGYSTVDFGGDDNTNTFDLNVDLTNVQLGLIYKF